MLVNSVRKADTAKGTGKKSVEKIERELEKFATRSIQATMVIHVGDRLELDKNFKGNIKYIDPHVSQNA